MSTSNKKTRNEQRRENYAKLRKAGFSAKDATKLKSRSLDFIKQACKEKRAEIKKEIWREEYHKARAKGFSSKESKKIASLGKEKRAILNELKVDEKNKQDILDFLTNFSYFKIPPFQTIEEYKKNYLEPYSYVIKYIRKDGTYDYITVTSKEKLTPEQLKNHTKAWFDSGIAENKEKYTAVPIIENSAFCDAAVVNIDAGGVI